MKQFSLSKKLKQKKGFASIEATVLLVLFVSLVYYSFGFFGVVHTAVVHNIHSRTYLFETFRHRTNLMYFRSNRPGSKTQQYYNHMTRMHGINTDTKDFAGEQTATERSISMGLQLNEEGRRASVHNQDVFNRVPSSGRNTSIGVNPVWIMTMYGICLNSRCGS